MRRFLSAVATLVLACMAASVVWVGYRLDECPRQPAEPARQRQYSLRVADGVRFRDFQNFGVDRLSFDSCRVEKRRCGAVSFGAFNVLVVNGLVLNLAEEASDSEENDGAGDVLNGGFAETFLRSQNLQAARFSGMRINELTVNRFCSNRLERVFSAARAESGMGRDGLRLRECVVASEAGGEERVCDARLELKPELALVYRRGSVERRMKMGELCR